MSSYATQPDVRFAKDQTPYKTHQGAYVAIGPATGWYVEISARGLRTGGGFYDAAPPVLAAYREAVDEDRTGRALERLLRGFEADGWEVSGETLKTAPRGWTTDHPRIELLRHKSLTVGRSHGFEPVIHTAAAADVVRRDWQALRPLMTWLATHVHEESHG